MTLGISIYPSKSTLKEMQAYLDTTAALGYKRIFTSMLEVADNPDETLDLFKTIIHYGNDLGMATTIDINPSLFQTLKISYDDLSLFHELGADAIRLDEGFTGMEEAAMTQNPFGLKVEINISRGQHYIDLINDFGPNRQCLMGSHNFYPQTFTGLEADYFVGTAKQYKNYNLNTAAFIDTPSGKVGPWPNSNLMVSAEVQRTMNVQTQVRWLKMLGVIDDILISSSMVATDDLQKISEAYYEPLPALTIEFNQDATELERKIVLESKHMYRGDYSGYMIRSTMTRVHFKHEENPAHHTTTIELGDVTVGNNQAGQYKNETQIALKERPNLGEQHNVVGKIVDGDLALLKLIQPWQSFKIVEA
ncbi:MAG: MupG family TIM beta-alpha barrel fold protein [Lactobacillaceae bacterium]|jgi:hypothetical protein|nr:MupG family TIM beta-alpha barrel fold protein [Lactobacillaceae bacterium]